jgi:MFS family permease
MKIKRIIVYFAGFLFSLPLALTSYINSTFLEQFVNKYFLSGLYVFASLVTIWGLIKMPKILTRFGNRSTALVLSLLLFLSLLLLAFSETSFFVIFAFILYFVTSNILIASLDIFIEDFSKNSNVGRFRGFYLTITNGAWVLAQVISGSIIAKSSFTGIYLLSSIFMLLVAFIFIFFLSDFIDPKYKKVPILRTIKFFISNKHVSKIYLINFALRFFYTWMIIYTPIYLHEYLGFGWEQMGVIFTIMLLPFVFLSFPLGILSDKIGEKKMLIWGFFISALFTLLIPLIKEPVVILWAGILFATRVGAATIEIMSESFFFKVETEENADAISFFRNTTPLSYIIGPLFAIPILYYIPSFKYLFFILGAVMLMGLFVSLRLKDVR